MYGRFLFLLHGCIYLSSPDHISTIVGINRNMVELGGIEQNPPDDNCILSYLGIQEGKQQVDVDAHWTRFSVTPNCRACLQNL